MLLSEYIAAIRCVETLSGSKYPKKRMLFYVMFHSLTVTRDLNVSSQVGNTFQSKNRMKQKL